MLVRASITDLSDSDSTLSCCAASAYCGECLSGVDRLSCTRAPGDVRLDAAHTVVRTVRNELRIAIQRRIINAELHVRPVLLIHGGIELQAVLEPLGLPTDPVVLEIIAVVELGDRELTVERYAARCL